MDEARRTPPRFFKAATESESLGRRTSDTGIIQPRYLVHELVFACSPRPPPRFQISDTILTQADWCAVRAVARCEQGFLSVITTVGSGSRVFWH